MWALRPGQGVHWLFLSSPSPLVSLVWEGEDDSDHQGPGELGKGGHTPPCSQTLPIHWAGIFLATAISLGPGPGQSGPPAPRELGGTSLSCVL